MPEYIEYEDNKIIIKRVIVYKDGSEPEPPPPPFEPYYIATVISLKTVVYMWDGVSTDDSPAKKKVMFQPSERIDGVTKFARGNKIRVYKNGRELTASGWMWKIKHDLDADDMWVLERHVNVE